MKKIYFFIFSLLLYHPASVHAQKDSIAKKNDSAQTVLFNNGLNRVNQLSAERLSDSLKRGDLQRQVSLLKDNDKLKKNELVTELSILKERDSIHLIRQQHQVDSLRKFVKGFPVVFAQDTLFYIYTKQGSFTAAERAEAVSNRISKISQDLSFKTDSLKQLAAEQTTDLYFKNILLISLSEQDALWASTDKEKLAANIKQLIGKHIIKHQQETSWEVLLKEVLLTMLVIGIVISMIIFINKLFKWFSTKIHSNDSAFKQGIQIKNYELLNAESQLRLIGIIINFFRWAIIILIVYLALPVLFGIFPFTKDLSVSLLNYTLSPVKKIGLAIWNYVPNMITILVLVIVFRYVLRFFRFVKIEIEKGKLTVPGFYKDWANPTYQIIRVLVMAFMLIVIFPYLPGSDSGVFKGVSVFMGVLFTFGSAGALGNIVAGLVLTYMRAFTIGDRVKIGEVTGDIIEKTLLVTRIRTIQNEVVSIPNSTVMGNHTINYSVEANGQGLIVHTTVTIGYDVPWRQVHQLLIAAASETEMIDQKSTPYVLQTSLDDYYVSYRINAFTKMPNKQALIYSSLHAKIQDHFNEAGVEIMSPHYKAIRDGNATTVPPSYLPDNYSPPVFRTQQKKAE
ncbi:mechanosensitive ion channel family protein [Pedobacter sp. L105]|uniref:mechanosensitive ion channel family protein n=1 Tax=Pedobacter sp. L105 TaxID=1641871 RepID=UPI00131DFD05|nr:mechanosensitive ion channel family protein [Pedobacter sp. L105]